MPSELELAAPNTLPVVPSAAGVDERLAATDPATVLPAQLLLATDRAAWLGARLREQVEIEGVHGVVGDTYEVTMEGRAVRVGEAARVLFELEARERDRVATLAEKIEKLNLRSTAQARHQDVGRWVAAALNLFAIELGLDLDAPEVNDAALRAVRQLGEQRAAQHRDGAGG